MFNLFKRKPLESPAEQPQTREVITAVSVQEPKIEKTVNEIIEEIHESFYTEVDRLLEQAKIMKSEKSDNQQLIDKAKKLIALGFKNTKETKLAEEELERLKLIEEENVKKKALIETIEYFSVKYPNYKFITRESVLKICDKYNLVLGWVNDYIGTVPDKNVEAISDFKVDENDECYARRMISSDQIWVEGKRFERTKSTTHPLSKKQYDDLIVDPPRLIGSKIQAGKCELEIAAPLKDFDMKGKTLEGRQIKVADEMREIPDPVVLKPVFHNGKKHYLIVTAWGLEASDELVVNQKMN